MGFARKEREGQTYRPVADAATVHRAPDTSQLVSAAVPASGEGAAATAPAVKATTRDVRTAMLALSRYHPAPLTASERAFIELRRGFSE